MGLKQFGILLLFLSFEMGVGQNQIEIGAVFDNDLYTSTVNDKYYTNGFEFYLRRLQTENTQSKSLLEYKIGQKIFNPFAIRVTILERTDRPFAGYLYASIGKNTFHENGFVFKKSIEIGFVGPNALGQEMQEFFHNTFGYKKVLGWENQIRNTLALQGTLFFAEKMNHFPKVHNTDAHWATELNLGTIFNGMTTGPLIRIGIKKTLAPIHNSILLGGGLSNQTLSTTQKELFLFAQPQVNFQLYDATIQGSLFGKKSPVERDITYLRFGAKAGVAYRINQWHFSYSVVYKTRETTHPGNEGHYYGSIAASCFL
ncbi:MAG: lipid A deacylase LpxR family protein [Flavobacterium sp.]